MTNTNGIAEVTVTGISGTVTFTGSYSNVSAQCTVTEQTYLFYDECNSASGLSNYGSSVLVRGSNATITMSYDSTENAYKLSGSGNYHAMIPIPALNDKDSYTIEADFKGQSVAFNSVGFFLDNRNDTTSYGLGVFMQVYDRKFISRQYKVSADGTQTTQSNLTFNTNNWYHMEMTVNGSSLTGNLYNGDTLMGTVTQTLTVNNKQMGLFLFCEGGATTSTCYVKNIKVKSLSQTYLFYDSCASDNTSQYTNFYEIWGATTTVNTSLTFDTDHYVLTNSNASFSAVCLPVSAGLDNLKLTAKIRLLTNSTDKGGGVGVATKREKGLAIFQPNGTSKHLILNNYQGAISSNVAVNNLSTNDYNTFELIKSGQSLTFSIYDATGTQRFTKQITVSTNTDYSNCIPCINVAKSDSIYVKEIKLESL